MIFDRYPYLSTRVEPAMSHITLPTGRAAREHARGKPRNGRDCAPLRGTVSSFKGHI